MRPIVSRSLSVGVIGLAVAAAASPALADTVVNKGGVMGKSSLQDKGSGGSWPADCRYDILGRLIGFTVYIPKVFARNVTSGSGNDQQFVGWRPRIQRHLGGSTWTYSDYTKRYQYDIARDNKTAPFTTATILAPFRKGTYRVVVEINWYRIATLVEGFVDRRADNVRRIAANGKHVSTGKTCATV